MLVWTTWNVARAATGVPEVAALVVSVYERTDVGRRKGAGPGKCPAIDPPAFAFSVPIALPPRNRF